MIPDQLAKLFAQEALPWNQAEAWDINEFLKAYTLHDSLWLGLQFDVVYDGAATAAIAFDPVWNKTGQEGTPECSTWPTLLIRFPETSQFSKEGYADIGGMPRGISGAAVARDGGLAETTITDHYGGKVVLRHVPRVAVLCYSSQGVLLRLGGQIVEQAASPNGGPTERLGNSGVGGGPPSVS